LLKRLETSARTLHGCATFRQRSARELELVVITCHRRGVVALGQLLNRSLAFFALCCGSIGFRLKTCTLCVPASEHRIRPRSALAEKLIQPAEHHSIDRLRLVGLHWAAVGTMQMSSAGVGASARAVRPNAASLMHKRRAAVATSR
jgi:hypothetical protein